MQRRNGKGAHISVPHEKGSLANGDGVGVESGADITGKGSRLGQRTLGLTHRIWLILGLVLFIFLFTSVVLPPDSSLSLPRHGLTNANLRPKNYINASEAEPQPFAFCPVFGPGDEVGAKYGVHALAKTRLHLGSGARVQRVIHKAMSGLPVTISVLGGSQSACHGAGDDPISPKCYPARFFQWWNSVFPHPASELTNGAVRRSNSAYFSFCNSHHLPDNTDLVILDFDVDDPNDKSWIEHFELLVRSVLVRPDQPAVIILGHFSPQVQQMHGYNGPEVLHSIVAQFYDVPHISIKPILYNSWVQRPDTINAYFADPMLANPSGHQLTTEVLIAYIQSQICAAWSVVTGQSYDVPFLLSPDPTNPLKKPTDARGLFGGIGPRPGGAGGAGPGEAGGGETPAAAASPHLKVPMARIGSRPTDGFFEEVAPFCVSANDLINPLPPSLFYGSGWLAHHPPAAAPAEQSAYAHYWYSTLPTSKLRVPIQVGAGDVAIYYLKEPVGEGGLNGVGSAVECWVDDNYRGARLLTNAADIADPTPVVEIIDRRVTRGSHFVECQLVGEEGRAVPAFRLLGVFTS